MISKDEQGESRCPYRRRNTGTIRCQDVRMPPWWFWLLGVPTSFAAVAGNGFVAYLIITQRQLHNPANWIVLSLAVADLAIGASYVLIESLYNASLLSHGAKYSLGSFLEACSALNLCLLILDRYIYFTRPLQYAVLATTRRCLVAIFGVWATDLLSHCLFFIICIKMPPSVDQKCMEDFATFDFVLFETLPMIVLAFAFGRIFSITRKISQEVAVQLRQLRFNYDNEAVETARPSERKDKNTTVKLFGIAVAAFAVCYLNEELYCPLPDRWKNSFKGLFPRRFHFVFSELGREPSCILTLQERHQESDQENGLPRPGGPTYRHRGRVHCWWKCELRTVFIRCSV